MGEYDEVGLDRTTVRAWDRFRGQLADHIIAMEDDDVLVVDAESSLDEDADGAAPYVQFCAWGEDTVRAEVSSNEYLDVDVWLDDDAEAVLVGLGWNAPTRASDEPVGSGSANFYVDAERRECDRLAAMAVAALRDVFGVPHPAFLSWPEAAAGIGDHVGGDIVCGLPPAPEPLVVEAESPEQLRELAGAALTPPGGPAIEYDEDGDIPLPMGSALLFVRVSEVAPVIEVFSCVVRDVRDTERAAFEVAVLNRDTRMVKFVLVDDAVLATAHLPAMLFAPRQLRALVSAMAEVVDRIDDDLVARVGGRRGLEADAEADEPGEDVDDESDEESQEDSEARDLHPALLTLIHLDPHGEGVDAGLAASVCEYDRDLVLRFLREASEQEIEWRKSGNLALMGDDTDEAKVCFGEARAWQATLETLRSALRVIVEQQRAESSPAPTERRVRHDRPRPRRRGERPRQQSLIDDALLRRHGTGQTPLFEEPDA